MNYDYLKSSEHKRKLNIAMVSDFFYPNIGGVESHIYALSQCLIRRGHHVVVITHSYGSKQEQRQGVRYMARGLKVYYVPYLPFYKECIFITIAGTLPIIREIILREKIDIVHGHSIFSTFASEAVVHAQSLGCSTVFTEHSLFGFSNLSEIIMNKVMEGVFKAVDELICVSHTTKENVTLRAKYDPNRIFVIPNAIDASAFKPNFNSRDLNYVTVVIVSRLVYRKGIDLLVPIIPRLCTLFPEVRFLIGGDGPKRLKLEELRERHQLHSRVKLLGSLLPHQVRSLLVQGDIFLNTSLTESFCMAIIEAVSCGLMVISTAVGGIPEVLPEHFIRLVPAKVSDLTVAMINAVREVQKQRKISGLETQANPDIMNARVESFRHEEKPNSLCSFTLAPYSNDDENTTPHECKSIADHGWHMHEWIRNTYSWSQVAKRTEKVYAAALARPSLSIGERISNYYKLGAFTGKLVTLGVCLHFLLLIFLSWIRPENMIDIVPRLKFPIEEENDAEDEEFKSNNEKLHKTT